MKSSDINSVSAYRVFQTTIIAALVCACSFTVAYGQKSGGNADMDATLYRYDSSLVRLELSYGILYRVLSFKQDGSNWVAPIKARVEAWQDGKLVASQDITKDVRFQGTKAQLEANGATLALDAAGFTIPANANTKVALLWYYTSPGGKQGTDTITRDLGQIDNDATHLAVSGLELASRVEKSNGQQSPFEKVGYIVSPNPSSVFGDEYTKLYYYCEVYVPKSMIDPTQSVEITTRILDGSGKEMLTMTRSQALLNSVIPFIGSADIDGLPGDTYKLEVLLKRQGSIEAQVTRRFYYESSMQISEDAPTPTPGANDQAIYLNSAISRMSENELDERFMQAKYIAKATDIKAYEALKDLDAKRKYFFSFWRNRDKDIAHPLSAYDEYYLHVAEANKQYTYQKTPGWKSDRGRVYIMYGPPDQITGDQFSTEAKPYITWNYQKTHYVLSSGSIGLPTFVFLDKQGGGKYMLVHSNVLGETAEPDWYNAEARRTR
ncbi:MAG: GWxTD domain-containing protein [Candidatus Kapaibacterium sp.]|jgi:GWxTD domain-containing protein